MYFFDFEYIFHTHPATPKPGSRTKDNILYEFPSVSDLFHFIDHYNLGKTQGSIIITPEGIYIIKCINSKLKINIKNENKIIIFLENELYRIQERAIKKFGYEISEDKFFKKVANDKTYIEMYNIIIKDLNLKIFYKSRVLKNKKWILEDLYLKVRPIE